MEKYPSSSYDRKFIKRDILVCRFYRQGFCPDEEDCLLPHVNNPERIPDRACRYYIKENCTFGNRCDYDHVHFLQRNGEIILELVRSQDKFRQSSVQRLKPCSSERDSRLSEVPVTTLRETTSVIQSPELLSLEQSKTKCDNSIDCATANVSYSKVDRKTHNPLTSNIEKCGTLSSKQLIQTSSSRCDNTLCVSQSLRYNDVSAYNDSPNVKFCDEKRKCATGRKYPNSEQERGELRMEHLEMKRISSNRSRTSNISLPFTNPCNVSTQGRITKDNTVSKKSPVKKNCVLDPNISKIPVNSSSYQTSRSIIKDVTEDKFLPNSLSMPSTSENYGTGVIVDVSKKCEEISTPNSRTLSSCEKNKIVQSPDSVFDVKQPKAKFLDHSVGTTTGYRYWSGLIDLVEQPQEHLNIKTVSNERSDTTCSTFQNLFNAYPKMREKMEDRSLKKTSANKISVSSSEISQKFLDNFSPSQTFMDINNDVNKDTFRPKDSSEERKKIKDNLKKPSVNKTSVSSAGIPKYSSNLLQYQKSMNINNEVIKGKFYKDYLSIPSTSKSSLTVEKKEDLPKNFENIATPTYSAESSYERFQFAQPMPDPVPNLTLGGVREPRISLLGPLSNDPRKRCQTFDINQEPSDASNVAYKPATGEWKHGDQILDAKLSKMQSLSLASNSEIRKTVKPNSPTTPNKTREGGYRKSKAMNSQTWRHQSEGQN